MPLPPTTQPTKIIALSGPSSSGKTTLARLLHRIFTLPSDDPKIHSLLIHEDDFYHPDDKIPQTTLPTGTVLQNWDTAGALDLAFLAASLSYVRTHGRLPPRLRSKEDQNDSQPVDSPGTGTGTGTGAGVVAEGVVEELQRRVRQRLVRLQAGARTVAFVEGFLLFAPPAAPAGLTPTMAAAQHPLREVHERMDGRLFLPAAYDKVKERRERRSGYVTIGAAPVPVASSSEGQQSGGDSAKDDRIDLEAEDDRPPQNFWTDPPGYVDDIVWPNYVKDHAWLLLPEEETEDEDRLLKESDPQVLVRLVGQGTRVREHAGVTVAPGRGDKPITELLTWAVEEVLKHLEETV
ncbi:hypothetical protein BO82DRAFT_348053 [Aspergillus uvarum CBS 121591]|uniref:Nicotinamide riboside kinase 1 n=1 Tax=Aspergillus uvarum CBS 121591 TaxID=1448315 RepID=A0A319BU89_9EURO|nr:hypothetical protein BO82DRAFT_348053 [Aspergillus uvarum CBS 121591]PYH76011.1 hypothetical protein BO82DRAFT_348053 [Aspergillus uvarum CBS 121591]